MMRRLLLLLLLAVTLPASASIVIIMRAPAGGGGQDYTDDFGTDPASRWTPDWTGWTWSGTNFNITKQTGTGDSEIVYDSQLTTITQCACITITTLSNTGVGVSLRADTATGAGTYSLWCQYYPGYGTYIMWSNNDAWAGDHKSRSYTFTSGDRMCCSVSGTGATPDFKVWDSPGTDCSGTPTIGTGGLAWTNVGDLPAAVQTDTENNYRCGVNAQTDGSTHVIDNFRCKDN